MLPILAGLHVWAQWPPYLAGVVIVPRPHFPEAGRWWHKRGWPRIAHKRTGGQGLRGSGWPHYKIEQWRLGPAPVLASTRNNSLAIGV